MSNLKYEIDSIVEKHTGEWKAGHEHLVTDQLLELIESEMLSIIGEDTPEISKGTTPNQYFQNVGRNKLRQSQRNALKGRLSK